MSIYPPLSMSEQTVFVVDDDDTVREVITSVLADEGFHVQAFASAENFLFALDPNRHGCLVLDMVLPGMSGADLQATLVRRGVDLPIVFISAHGDIPTTVKVMRDGALDFLTKPIDPEILLTCVRSALERDSQMRQEQAQRLPLIAQVNSLSPREREILDLALAGMQNKDIARRLSLSHRTVEAHRARMFLKLGVKSLIEIMNLMAELDIPLHRAEPAEKQAASDAG
jgi:two-component system response regulator FixJ